MIEQLVAASDTELLAEIVDLECELSRLQYRQLSVLAELNARNVAGTLGFRGLPDLIAAQLRCSRAEARKRYLAVERFGARRSLTGEPVDPKLPATAEAFATGEIGSEHAAAIADAVEAIPVVEQAEHAGQVETTLLEHARTSDPRTVRLLGQRILAHLDPDGPSPEERRRQQSHRRLSLSRLADSTGLLEGHLTPTCQAIWETISPRSRRSDPMMPSARMTGRRRRGCMMRSRRPADACWRQVTCRIRPGCPAS